MSITRNLEIKITNGEAKLNEKVYVYQNDRGIELRLKLSLISPNFRTPIRSSLFETPIIFAAATILKPNGNLFSKGRTVLEDDNLIFKIDKEFTDEIDEIGVYKIQFHLYDTDDNRLTIPPIEFEVRELIGMIDEDELTKYGVVDKCFSDGKYSVYDDGKEVEIFSNGKYIKTIWNCDDLITSNKLNKIEEAIEYLDNQFYIGDSPLREPMIWIDVPNLHNQNLIADDTLSENEPKSTSLKEQVDFFDVNENLSNIDKEKYLSSDGDVNLNTLLEILNSITDKLKLLEEEIELLKK